jgi:hypothetical protein
MAGTGLAEPCQILVGALTRHRGSIGWSEEIRWFREMNPKLARLLLIPERTQFNVRQGD